MGFSAPGLLGLAALAAVPLAIHIFSRLRLRRADFPSLLLLRTVRRERFSWVRLKEVLLLVLRTVALLALLTSLARPFLTAALPALGRGQDVVLVIDDSYSMGYSDRWSRAVAAARAVVTSLGPGRRAVIMTSSGGGALVSPAALDTLRPTGSPGPLGPALERALPRAESLGAALVAVTDLQQRALGDSWRASGTVPVVLLDVGDPGFDNAAVARLYPDDPFAAAGRPVGIRADVVNYGAREVTRTLVLSVDGQREEKVLTVPAFGRRTVAFETAVSTAGTHRLHAELRSDSLALDDDRWLVLALPERTRVLIVESERVPADFVVDALAPDSAGLELERAGRADLARRDLREFGVLVCTDGAALEPGDWDRVDFYLRSGGAALVMAGTAAEGRLGALARTHGTARPEGFVSVTEIDTTHPVFGPLGAGALATARVWTHSRLDATDGRVLARLSDGDPLVLESRAHRLVFWSVGPGPEFSDLVFKAAFVPLLHRTVSWLARTRLDLDCAVADTIRLPVDRLAPVTVTGPDLHRLLEPVPSGSGAEVTLAGPLAPGIYSFEAEDGTPVASVAVNPEPGEGDLARAAPDLLRLRGIDVRDEYASRTSDLVVPLLYVAAAAIAAELLLLVF